MMKNVWCWTSSVLLWALVFLTHHEDGVALVAASQGELLRRVLALENKSWNALEIFWMHPQTDAAHPLSSIEAGQSHPIQTFVGHTFELRAMPNPETGNCESSEDKTCAVRRFTVGEDSHPVVTVHEDMEIEMKNVVKYEVAKQTSEGVGEEEAPENSQIHLCQEKAKEAIRSSLLEPEKALDELVNCAMWNVTKTLVERSEEVAFHANRRMSVALNLENFTCADQELPTSTPLEIRSWVQPENTNTKNKEVVERDVHVMHERQASRVHLIKNFVSEEECEAMERAAKPILHRATVADGKGGSQFSPSRKAMQAGIKVKWSMEADGDHIASLSRRVYDYANHVLDLNITEHGQEDLMSIQYFGREDDKEPDRYMPHCDGDCHGEPHKWGTRMATMVMYCKVPLLGGATNFRNSGLHIVPEMGSATFFSYIDPNTRKMDRQFTEHSGCPVLMGEKKIVTQWIRLGVDNENPWDSFNTLGVKKSEQDDD